jgi:signal transduction histidine kinase/ActR/RegA family two-component response regulator
MKVRSMVVDADSGPDPEADPAGDGAAGQRSGGSGPAAGLAQWLSEFARELQAQPNKDGIMEAVVRAAVDKVPGAEFAGITLVSHQGEITTPGNTDEIVVRIDALQVETGEGPCLSTAREHLTVRADDMSAERRWPKFAAAAAEAGVGSMLCLQLFVRGDSLGALNLLARARGAFDETSEDIGLLVASHAAIAMIGADREGDLTASEHELEVALAGQIQVVQRLHVLDGLKYTVLQTLAHDLRGPIAAVLTLTGMLSSGLTADNETVPVLSPEAQLQFLSDIERSAQKIKRLLHDLVSSDPLQPIEARRTRCNVADLISRVLTDDPITRSHPIHTQLEPVTVNVDAAQVERIVENLVRNAEKHLDAGVAMWIKTESVGPGVLITVEDAGPGVPVDMRDEIFEPFRRGPENPHPGLGLGLSLVSRYAQIHDGRAWVQEREGGGASFRVYLPDNDAARTATAVIPTPLGAVRVLICDDDAILSDALKILVTFTPGLEMVASPVQTGQQAIDAVTRHQPDVVVMDVDLIGPMNGFEATTRIRDISPTTHVVIMSGTTEQGRAQQRAKQAGASTFLPKGGSNADLINAIRAAAGRGRGHRPDRKQLSDAV